MSENNSPALDLTEPNLLTGRVVIQASAGTGKTYSLTVLVVRHVAERGLTADQLLMVTFTNAATTELRDKTREQARETLQRLRNGDRSQPWMAPMMSSEDSLSRAVTNLENFLARFDDATITTIHGFCQIVLKKAGLQSPAPPSYVVRDNIDDIIDQVITDLLVEELAGNPALFAVDTSKAQDDAVGPDVAADDVRSALSRLKSAVDRVMGNPRALALPAVAPSPLACDKTILKHPDGPKTETAELIATKVLEIVDEVRRRCRVAGIITYDDMVRLVADTLDPQPTGNDALDLSARESARALASEIASQFSLVMVDEFQDTDSSQWSIFSKVHDSNPDTVTLVTVGDPKQAIYRFRGADVQVYIDAVRDVEQTRSLKVNYRSDAGLLSALQTLLEGVNFAITEKDQPEGKGIASFEKVDAAEKNENGALHAASSPPRYANVPGAPLEIRYLANHASLGAAAAYQTTDKNGKKRTVAATSNNAAAARGIFWRDVTNHVVELLEDGLLPDKGSDVRGAMRRVTPNDIAVLVTGHKEAEIVVQHLQKANIPAVRLKTDSVFRSQAAMQWMMLLGALANPGKPQFVRARALSWFGSATEQDLLAADVDLVSEWQQQCAADAALLQRRGVAALYLSHRNRPDFLRKVLAETDGERHITDLDHIAELLGAMPGFALKAGAAECFEALTELVEDSSSRVEEHERRIEGDDIAVKVLTIYASKGLQFPIVFLPTLANTPSTKGAHPRMFSFRFPGETSSRRVIDVASGFDKAEEWVFDPKGVSDESFASIRKDDQKKNKMPIGRKVEADKDRFFDRLRLLYVALTRAEHKVVLYWSNMGEQNKKGNGWEPLAKVLARHGSESETSEDDLKMPMDSEALRELMDTIAETSKGTIEVIELDEVAPPAQKWTNEEDSTAPVVAEATFVRDVPVRTSGHARWSYSGLADTLKGHFESEGVDLAGATDETNDEPLDLDTGHVVEFDRDATIAAMPMHGVTASAEFGTAVHEIIDAVDPGAVDIDSILAEAIDLRSDLWADPAERALISAGLSTVFRAPLGVPFEGNTLRSLGTDNRLSELEFNFRLPQDSPFVLSRIGELMLEHGDLDPNLAAYARSIADNGASARVAGFMRGFIDAVFRIESKDGPVYVVADYKTNRLHDPKNEGVNPLAAYHPDALVAPMVRNDYILQALVYSVALHRYLRWRQPGYDPSVHLGGSAYLFLRGMTGQLTAEATPRPFGVHHWQPTTALIESVDRLFAKGV